MAVLNKITAIGRATADPESKVFDNGGKVVKFTLAIANPRWNERDQKWDDDPAFIDVKIFNNGQKAAADKVESTVRKGFQVLVDGRIKQENWTDRQTGQKRSKLLIEAYGVQVLSQPNSQSNGQHSQQQPRQQPQQQPSRSAQQPQRPQQQTRRPAPPPPPPDDHVANDLGYDPADATTVPEHDIPF